MVNSERRSSCRGSAGDGAREERHPLLERILQPRPRSTLGAPQCLGTWVLLSSCCSPHPASGMVGPPAPPQSPTLSPSHSGAVLGGSKGFLGVWCECSIPPQARRADSLGGAGNRAMLKFGLTGTRLTAVEGEAGLPIVSTKSLLWAGTLPASGGCCTKQPLLLWADSRSLGTGREWARELVCSLARQGRDTSSAFSADLAVAAF